ncbi:MAG: hypothetical protein BGN96_05295 [Bacteroidales bacterium 45-6]|nr:MAG: hypothetical protein BGN96_05295 [Bacteroidales bacterium 45-6]
MKKKYVYVATALLIAGSITFSSCIGSFSLTHKVLSWNQTLDNKFVNELVFIALHIVPVYPVAIVIDGLVINSIEFWTGDNPMEAGIVKKVQGQSGVYTVETLKDGYKIKDEKGQQMNLVYDKKTNTWNMVADGQTTKLLKVVDKDNAVVYVNGQERNVALNAQGVLAFKESVDNSRFVAQK